MEDKRVRYLRSHFWESRYFTPPKIDPIGLDAASLDGGGYAPAQFCGKTHDGRNIYCRYRWGRLTVTVANRPGVDSLDDGTCILDVGIGPPAHGGMTLGQLCHYTGITINGECPPLPDPKEMYEEGCKDLGGATRFYDVRLISTFVTQKRFLTTALEALSGVTLIQPTSDRSPRKQGFSFTGYNICREITDLTSDFTSMLIGPEVDEMTLKNVSLGDSLDDVFPQNLIVRVRTQGFEHPLRKDRDDNAGRARGLIRRRISVPGQSNDCLRGTFSLHSDFVIKDDNRRSSIESLDGLLDQFYPRIQITHFDLKTGRRQPEDEHLTHYDPEIVRWVNDRDNRYLSVSNLGDWRNPRFVGARATPAT